jgi:NTE family protein
MKFFSKFGIALTASFLGTALLGGCASFDYVDSDSPVPMTLPLRISPSPRVAVVLGSGGPRGFAHVGVIKALEAQGISPDLIVGSSVGALIGAFWASGLSANDIEARSKAGDPLTLFDINPFADRGWIRGQRLQDYVTSELGAKSIEQLGKPLMVVATRRDDKTPIFFMRGHTGVAIRASSAVPRVISPVGIGGVEYEDADVSLPLAVSAARVAGAQFVIAVDVSAHESSTPADASPDWRSTDAARRARIAPEVAKADFLIHPDLGYIASPGSAYADNARATGEAATLKVVPGLMAAIKQRFGQWPLKEAVVEAVINSEQTAPPARGAQFADRSPARAAQSESQPVPVCALVHSFDSDSECRPLLSGQ